jgi:hypothetical protein
MTDPLDIVIIIVLVITLIFLNWAERSTRKP